MNPNDIIKSDKFSILIVLCSILVSSPFILLVLGSIFGTEQRLLYTFQLPLPDFILSWITLWGVIVASIGLYRIKQTQEDRLDEEKYRTEMIEKNDKTVRFSRFCSYVESLGGSNPLSRINAINSLYALAKFYPDEFRDNVCTVFVSSIRENKQAPISSEDIAMPPDVHRLLELIIIDKDSVFISCPKDLSGCIIINWDLRSATFSCNINLSDAKFIGCNFHDVKIHDVICVKTQFIDCVFKSSEICYCNFHKSTFKKSTFDKTKLKGLTLSSSSMQSMTFMRSCVFEDINFTDSKFCDTSFDNPQIGSKIEFGNCSFTSTTFSFTEKKVMDAFTETLKVFNIECSIIENNILCF